MWEPLSFPNPPSARYGAASASSIGSGLYVFGGFGMQGSSQLQNPYTAYGSSGLASYKQNPAAAADKQKPRTMAKRNTGTVNKQSSGTMAKQNFYPMNPMNPMNPTGYNNYRDNDDRDDENFYPLPDAWFLNYALVKIFSAIRFILLFLLLFFLLIRTKTWQNIQTSQYARGLGSAAATPYPGGIPRVIYSMGKSRDWMYSIVETTGQVTSGFNQMGAGPGAMSKFIIELFLT